jgi:type II secretion system protein I
MNSRGFTVMEILVALFIFSIIVLPLAELLSADSKFEKKYEEKQVAMLVAKNELEKAKRSYKKPVNDTFQVTMAGKKWDIAIAVEEKELALVPARKTLQTGQLPTDSILPVKPETIGKRFITVRVSRPSDTATLAEFRVMKETYK